MKLYDREPYSWYIKKCRDSIFDAIEPSGNPEHRASFGRNPKKIDAYLNEWYIRGLINEIYDIAWDDFKFQTLDGWGGKYLRNRWPYYRSSYSLTHCDFRDHTHYVRNVDHEPK
ncbi:MAG: hypothetical protein ACRDHZ_25335, partial [Ktedonobacteraceae bacterium]